MLGFHVHTYCTALHYSGCETYTTAEGLTSVSSYAISSKKSNGLLVIAVVCWLYIKKKEYGLLVIAVVCWL